MIAMPVGMFGKAVFDSDDKESCVVCSRSRTGDLQGNIIVQCAKGSSGPCSGLPGLLILQSHLSTGLNGWEKRGRFAIVSKQAAAFV